MSSFSFRSAQEIYLYDLLYLSPCFYFKQKVGGGRGSTSLHFPVGLAGPDRLAKGVDLLSAIHPTVKPRLRRMGGWSPPLRLSTFEPVPWPLLDRLLADLLPLVRRKELLSSSVLQSGGRWTLVLKEVAELKLPTYYDLFGWGIPVRLDLRLPIPFHFFRLYFESSTTER